MTVLVSRSILSATGIRMSVRFVVKMKASGRRCYWPPPIVVVRHDGVRKMT